MAMSLEEAIRRRNLIEAENPPGSELVPPMFPGEIPERVEKPGQAVLRARAEQREAFGREGLAAKERMLGKSAAEKKAKTERERETMAKYWPSEATGGETPPAHSPEIVADTAGKAVDEQRGKVAAGGQPSKDEGPLTAEQEADLYSGRPLGQWGKISPGAYNIVTGRERSRITGDPRYAETIEQMRLGSGMEPGYKRRLIEEMVGPPEEEPRRPGDERSVLAMKAWGIDEPVERRDKVMRGSMADITSRMQAKEIAQQERAQELAAGAQDVEAMKQAASEKQLTDIMKMPPAEMTEIRRNQLMADVHKQYQGRISELSRKHQNWRASGEQTPGRKRPVGESEDMIDQMTLAEATKQAQIDYLLATYMVDRDPRILQAMAAMRGVDPRLIEQQMMSEALQPQATRTAEGE